MSKSHLKVALAAVIALLGLFFLSRRAGAEVPEPMPAPKPMLAPEPMPTPIPMPPILDSRNWQTILQPYFPEITLSDVILIFTNSLPILPGIGAITFGNRIFIDPDFWDMLDENGKVRWLAHELVHVVQWKRSGVSFFFDYIFQMVKPHDNREAEIEAIDRSNAIAYKLGIW